MAKRFVRGERESYWRWHVDMHAASSLSVRGYCRKYGLSEPSFYAWRRKIRNQDAGPEHSPGSRPESRVLSSPGSSGSSDSGRVRTADAGHQASSRSKERRASVRSNGDSLRPSVRSGLVALDIIEAIRPTLEIEAHGGVLIRLREDVATEVLQRVIVACQRAHGSTAAQQEESSC
jgi:hypothetical protein